MDFSDPFYLFRKNAYARIPTHLLKKLQGFGGLADTLRKAAEKGKAKKRAIDMNNIAVPLRFNIIWKNVSDIRQWILRHRNMQPNDKTVDINTYLTNIIRFRL